MRRVTLTIAAVTGALALAACGSSGSSGKSSSSAPPSSSPPSSASSSSLPTAAGSVTVGSASFDENDLLAYIYGDAMAAKGVKVTYKLNIGERGPRQAALKDHSIGMVPEYTGSILYYLDTSATAKSPADVYTALQTAGAAQGLSFTQYAAAQDSDTITVTKATADKYHLSSIADLASVASKLTFGAPAQFQTRADGIPALKSVYGVTFGKFTALAAGGTFTQTALKNGSIDAGDIFSTDPSIAANNFVSLADPKSMFAAQNVVPEFDSGTLSQPMADACDAVSAKLDTKTLATLVAEVSGGKSAESVAKTWLSSNGLG
jgi:osmoprotectant transport system substrate-binding protein